MAILPKLVTLLLLINFSSSSLIYTALSPLYIRPQSTYSIITTASLNPEKTDNSPLTLNFEISSDKSGSIASQEVTFSKPGEKTISFDIKDLPQEYYNLTVKSSNKEDAEDRLLLQKETKDTSLLIQSDKPIYKPGETVKFRVLLLNRFFQPFSTNKSISVTLFDPQRNIIKSWKSLSIPPLKGFTSLTFDLSTEPNLGSWSIEAKDKKAYQSFQFSVDEYVLPKYKVSLNLSPSFVTYNQSKVQVEVSSIYSYGKPVPGECTVTLKDSNMYHYNGPDGQMGTPSVSKTTKLEDGKGIARFEFDIKSELSVNSNEINKWGKSFNFFASCKDSVSGHVRNETVPITMYQFPYKLDVVDRPERIKPGFPVNITIKVSTQDNIPISDEKVDALKIEHGFDFSAEGGVIYKPVPQNGLVVLPFVAPTNPKVCYEALEVTYKGLKESFWLPGKTVSPTGSYMQLKVMTQSSEITAGKPLKVNVRTSKPFKSLNIIVQSRGEVIHSELMTSDPTSGTKDQDILVNLPLKSSPSSRLLVFTTFPDNDLIADSLEVDISPDTKNDLEISLSENTSEPGSNISITVKGHKNSFLGLRGVDQSVLLLKKDNDINKEQLGNIANGFKSYTGNYWGGSDIFQLFVQNGFGILTNAKVDRGYSNSNPEAPVIKMYNKISSFEDKAYMEMAPVRQSAFASTPMAPMPGMSGGSSGANAAPRVRSFFPETWIWDDLESPEGHLVLTKPVPDTITSWMISGFQINPKFGLGLSTSPSKLTVFRPFFISLNLPYSIIKGEVLALQILVHNYMDQPIKAKVTLENQDQFFKFMESEDITLTKMEKEIELNASSISSVTFPISPLKFGTMVLNAKATTSNAGDAVKQPLIVKPPGIKHTQNNAVLINLLSQDKIQINNLTAFFPEQRVPEADGLKVSVIGDILGGTINNLDQLIRLPQGCGEQNMLNFVPDIVILDYLTSTGTLSQEIEEKAKNFLERGYQQQLTYLRYDNSYSAFGKSDTVGSTWLTAFVTRAFIQAQKYIYIDPEVINKSLRFLVRMQNDNGSFTEEGFVYDKSLQGGSSNKNQIALTAFTLLTFAEAQKAKIDIKKFTNATVLELGVNFLINQTSNSKKIPDPYEANLISYLLQIIEHPMKNEYFKVTQDLAKMDSDNSTIHWEQIRRQKPTESMSKLTWRPWIPRITPATVEITSYGLLTYLLKGDKLEDAVSIAKWLMKQRNAEGGFLSTQDTVVGLTALAKFAEAINTKEYAQSNVNIELMFESGSHSFYIGKDNKTDLQEYILPQSARAIDLLGKGKGTALAQLTWSYYVEAVDSSPAFNLTTELKDLDKGRNLNMKICTSYIRESNSLDSEDKSNMAILEANTPSGYAFDQEELELLRQSQVFKRYELEDKDSKVNLYFESISSKEICLELKAYRIYLVAKHEKGVVKVYDYYDNTQKAQFLYDVPAISLCDICKEETTCEIKECKE